MGGGRPPNGHDRNAISLSEGQELHWKLNHYAAILENKGGRYRVMDPTFCGEVWMNAETIDAEASGAFLVPKDLVPPGWKELSPLECAQIYGKGAPNDFNDAEDEGPDPCEPDEDDSTCDPPSSNDGPPGDNQPPPPPPCDCGMPIWKVSEPYITLWLEDTPLLYRLSNQKWLSLKLRYKHRGEYKGGTIFNFGDKWECNFLGYLTCSSNNPSYFTNHMAGGGVQAYLANGNPDYRTARQFAYEVPYGPALFTPTGARNRYGLTNFVYTALTNYFLTQRVDRYGRVLETFNYLTNSGMVRLSSIVDMDGKTITFSYNNSLCPYLVTSITDPYSRSNQFFYNITGTPTLTSIVDAMNMTTGIGIAGGCQIAGRCSDSPDQHHRGTQQQSIHWRWSG